MVNDEGWTVPISYTMDAIVALVRKVFKQQIIVAVERETLDPPLSVMPSIRRFRVIGKHSPSATPTPTTGADLTQKGCDKGASEQFEYTNFARLWFCCCGAGRRI